jgi:hypothetical protein
MFFTQWAPTRDETRNWESEISAFLEELAGALRQAGIAASLETQNRIIAIPLGVVISAADGGRPRALTEPATAFGRILDAHISCISRADRPRTACPSFRLLDLRHVQGEVRLSALPGGTELAQDRYARLVAIELAAGLFGQTPQLLGLTGSDGRPVIDIASAIAAAPTRDGLRGDVALRFAFDPPQAGTH